MKVDLLEEYKELYYKEIEHSERLNNKISTCITFLTILGSAQVLLWSQLKKFPFNISTIVYLLFCVASLVLFGICLYNFVHTFSGYKYNYFPIKDFAEATKTTYEIAGGDSVNKKRADNHIYNMYCERFVNDAINNRKCNTVV